MGRLHGLCDPHSPKGSERQNSARLRAKGSLREKGRAGAIEGGCVLRDTERRPESLVPGLSPALINARRGRAHASVSWLQSLSISFNPFSLFYKLSSPRLGDGDKGPEILKWHMWASHWGVSRLPWQSQKSTIDPARKGCLASDSPSWA